MSEIALGLGLGLGLGIPSCIYVVFCTWWLIAQKKENYVRQRYPNWSNSPAKSSASISPAKPMEDFSGSIDDAQTEIFSILKPTHLAAKSSDLNSLSVEQQYRSSEITNGEFPKYEPIPNSLSKKATIAKQDVSTRISISQHTTIETLV
jgi:hypothetical protein